MEQLLLIYRTVLTVPCWLLFYEGIGMGPLLTSFMRGEPRVRLSWPIGDCCLVTPVLSERMPTTALMSLLMSPY